MNERNETFLRIKKAGYRLTKRQWPTITVKELADLGITREMFGANTAQATIHMTMGPLWRYGIKLLIGRENTRVVYFR